MTETREPGAIRIGISFKSKSPSCGMERVKVYDAGTGMSAADGVGRFARAVMESRPAPPAEEEGRLTDPMRRESFIERVFAYKRWQAQWTYDVTAPSRLKLLLQSGVR